MGIKTDNNEKYINFVKAINKYDPKDRHISIPLATATECFEVAVASFDFNKSTESVNNYLFELGDLIWDLIALSIDGHYGLNENLIFNCLETGYRLSEKRRRKYLQYCQVHPLIKHGNTIIDHLHKLEYKNFYVRKKQVHRKGIFDTVLEISTHIGAMIVDVDYKTAPPSQLKDFWDIRIDIDYVLQINMKKLTAQVGKLRS